MEAAEASALDIARFREDLADEAILDDLAQSHTHAVEEYGVFGVPTLLFPSGAVAFLKAYRPADEDAVEMFESLLSGAGKWNQIGEIKRPQPPWPKGVFK
jgi:predicted DsbA family dithiol-disulfide isomerase